MAKKRASKQPPPKPPTRKTKTATRPTRSSSAASGSTSTKKKKPAKKKATKKKAAKKAAPSGSTATTSAARRPPAKKRASRSGKKKRGHTNAESVRQEIAALERDQVITTLYLEGLQTSEIARRIDLDPSTVRRRLRMIREAWQTQRLDNYDEIVAQCTATSRHVITLAFRAYHRSCQPEAHTLHRDTSHEGGEGGDTRTITEESRESPPGDPRFLELVGRMNGQIAQVHGLMDREARQAGAAREEKTALIELVVTDRRELADLQQMQFDQLAKLAARRQRDLDRAIPATAIAK